MRLTEDRCVAGQSWFRDLDSNQDSQLQRLMCYQLHYPGTAVGIVADEIPHSNRALAGATRRQSARLQSVRFPALVSHNSPRTIRFHLKNL